MKPMIGITTGAEEGNFVPGWPLHYANTAISNAIAKAGGLPVLLPPLEATEENPLPEGLAGLVVSGEVRSTTHDVVAALKTDVLQRSNPLRYRHEMACIAAAIKMGIPILGICRGHQVLAVAEGGRVSDKDVHFTGGVPHQQSALSPAQPVHTIDIDPQSQLFHMTGLATTEVNSFHRQAVAEAPIGYRVSACSPDGVIEAIESLHPPLRLGLQFHPEMLQTSPWQRLFQEFVKHCQR